MIDRVNSSLEGTRASLGGIPTIDRDFTNAIYENFPYLLLFVLVLTFILLARAFRSIVLAAKAVLLNLLSLTAAFGIVVFIFQWGYGSSLWNIDATQSIPAWIPLMIFAFLFGLSMDYEVFMLSRMREAYDETGDTKRSIELGLARTGKLVTSGAAVLAFAFLVLSSSPGYEIKPFAIGLAAGIIFDATVIRALLVPSLMALFGRWNWWMPRWTRALLFLPRREPVAGGREQRTSLVARPALGASGSDRLRPLRAAARRRELQRVAAGNPLAAVVRADARAVVVAHVGVLVELRSVLDLVLRTIDKDVLVVDIDAIDHSRGEQYLLAEDPRTRVDDDVTRSDVVTWPRRSSRSRRLPLRRCSRSGPFHSSHCFDMSRHQTSSRSITPFYAAPARRG